MNTIFCTAEFESKIDVDVGLVVVPGCCVALFDGVLEFVDVVMIVPTRGRFAANLN